MPRSSSQKIKLLALLRIFHEDSDQEHFLTVPELVEKLTQQGISVERKSVYNDIEALKSLGYDIDHVSNKGYRLLHRAFELAELKLLVDAVQSSRFIPARKSSQLIEKLERLTSRYQASSLQRQVYVAGRVKSMNQSIYYNIDTIHAAVSRNRRITFRYFKYNLYRQKIFRHGGALYEVSPFALLRSDENYYLIAYDQQHSEIRHYRVDKMSSITITDHRRCGDEAYQSTDLGEYARLHFGMFRGREADVTLRCENGMADILLDRFGEQLSMVPDGEDHFTTSVRLAVSPQFFGWLCGLGGGIVITGPDWVRQAFLSHLEQVKTQYGDV